MTLQSFINDPEPAGADRALESILSEIAVLADQFSRHAQESARIRTAAQMKRAAVEAEIRNEAEAIAGSTVGEGFRLELAHAFPEFLFPRENIPAPTTLHEAHEILTAVRDAVRRDVNRIEAARAHWEAKNWFARRREVRPEIPAELWRRVQLLQSTNIALPQLRERHIEEGIASLRRFNDEASASIASRLAAVEEVLWAGAERLRVAEQHAGLAASAWEDPRWETAPIATTVSNVLRLGDFRLDHPMRTVVERAPVLVDFPFTAGIAIQSEVQDQSHAVSLARSLVLRILAAVPPGKARFVFVDPQAVGQSVAEFRHLAEFDSQIVDVKTWTSEREITARLDELSAHLEIVISNYLRGQFSTIDEYNAYAGEVAEPYRILVVFDYPEAFTERSARQLLSIIENGPRCGVHTILVADPNREQPRDMPRERLIHAMLRLRLHGELASLTLPAHAEPVQCVVIPDQAPSLMMSPDGQARSPLAQLLLDVGDQARGSHDEDVTLERLLPIVNRLISGGRSTQMPALPADAESLDASRPESWWSGSTAASATAIIGRAGAQDVAAMYLSSTEIAGGAIMVGLPRSGKSTALHAAITSLAMVYPPEELDLYLVDSKHGVEFKVYEDLPHARLVSINSEREFAVSVLESLQGEIAARAKIMKERTAGRANITEFRNATGERMSRIVLVMDEFHEVFEEDDALGAAAFRAFSDIVREGPFAGVHVIVASQTLSSMPAMDRSTLSLLPIRLAFMCNEIDADLVMGDSNREVRALNRQGVGILNPVRGEPAHNKLFRGLYIPYDERDLILRQLVRKGADEGFSRHPRVFDGDNFAVRPTQSPAPGRHVRFGIGEPLGLQEREQIALRRARGANILVLGHDAAEDSADASVSAIVHSILVDAGRQGVDARLVDFLGEEATDDDGLEVADLCDHVGARYRRASALAETLAGLTEELARRRAVAEYVAPGAILILVGVQRADDLVAPAYDLGIADTLELDLVGDDGAAAGVLLAELLRDGPEFGIHVVVLADTLGSLTRRLGDDALQSFDWRIAGRSASQQDVATITDSFREAEIRNHQLLIVDRGRGRSKRVRAYPPFTSESFAATKELT
jgi:S-DNA-T family DNA segregation ATPase FtsK/SpoIIIE